MFFLSRVEKINSLSFERVRGAYINRQRTSVSVQRTTAIEPVAPAQNQTAFSSENHLIAYDNYYRQLKKLEKEFATFLGDKEYLEEQIKKEQQNRNKEKTGNLYKQIKSLINKYNCTVASLLYIDKNYNTNNLQELKMILSNYERALANLGIETRNLYLEINGSNFRKNFFRSLNPQEELFQPLVRLIMILYIKFRNIMLLKKSSYNSFAEDYKGTIINKSL